ncbi:hypothetical protein H9P43_003030 [Blastocladiella emersonii ATCC 22665]|nr:hypothetical protein H9P43_003030 [Blastocladiella emersonii ATCC 22665]
MTTWASIATPPAPASTAEQPQSSVSVSEPAAAGAIQAEPVAAAAAHTPSPAQIAEPIAPQPAAHAPESSSAPATPAIAAAAPLHYGNRTIYLSGLTADISLPLLLDHVHFGPLESARVVPEKGCGFLTFLDPIEAAGFYAAHQHSRLTVAGTELAVHWGRTGATGASPIPLNIAAAVAAGASRNVYVPGVPLGTTEAELRADFGPFGEIDSIRIVRPREGHQLGIAFVHFAHIASAMKCVALIAASGPKYAGRRLAYGKDRCAPSPRQQYWSQQGGGDAQAAPAAPAWGTPFIDPTFAHSDNLALLPADAHERLNPFATRTVYVGGLPDGAIAEDLCNVLRAGLIEKVSVLPGKHTCGFVTFVDPRAATLVLHLAETHGIVVRGRRVKCGLGKPTPPLAPNVAHAVVAAGATRCVYIGPLTQLFAEVAAAVPGATVAPTETGSVTVTTDTPTAAAALQSGVAAVLLADFAPYGAVEVIHVMPHKQCAFVNYANLRGAIRAVAEAPAVLHAKYGYVRIAYGRDRVAAPIRLPREPELPIGGMIPRRNNGSFVPTIAPAQGAGLPAKPVHVAAAAAVNEVKQEAVVGEEGEVVAEVAAMH